MFLVLVSKNAHFVKVAMLPQAYDGQIEIDIYVYLIAYILAKLLEKFFWKVLV